MNEEYSNQLEIYISYDRLRLRQFSKLLENLSIISDKIVEDYLIRYGIEGEFPTLDVNSIHTGNSIKFSLIEGWTPFITSDEENDIIVGVPRKLGIPLVIGYLLLTTASQYQELRNNHLDNKIKEIEYQLKQEELSKVLLERNENKDSLILNPFYFTEKVPEIKPILLDTIKDVLKNPEINEFKVNGSEIKDVK